MKRPLCIWVAAALLLFSVPSAAAAQESPCVFRADATVDPGSVLGLYGGRFGGTPDIAICALSDIEGAPSAAKAQWRVEPLNSGQEFVQCILPPSVPPDVYAVYVVNDAGASEPQFVNRAEPFCVSEAVVCAGQTLRVFGRNFLHPALDTPEQTAVWLTKADGTGRVQAVVVDATDYTVDILIPEGIDGQYSLLVTNGAGGDYGYGELPQEEAFTVVAISDTIAAVKQDFEVYEAWTSPIGNTVYNVRDFGAAGDGKTDDSQALQDALDTAGTTGGRVYLPAGDYCSAGLTIPNGVVVYGDGTEQTVLRHMDDRTGTKFLTTYSNAGGMADLTVISEVCRPEGDDIRRIGGYVVGLRIFGCSAGTPGGFFLKRVNMRITDGMAVYNDSDTAMLVMEDCDINASHSNVMNYSRARILDSRFFNTERPVLMLGSEGYSWVENNKIDAAHVGAGREPGTNDTEHRVMDLGILNNYVAGNYVTGEYGATTPNTDNSGEGILFQSNRRTGYGRVLSADAQSVTSEPGGIKPDDGSSGAGMRAGDYVAIVEGTGIGQLRRIAAVEGDRFTVDQPWDIVPDQTSVFSADYRVNMHNIVVDNNIDAKTKKGGIMLYTKNFDNIIANNRLNNTGGIWLGQSQVKKQYRADYSYFNTVVGNICTGASDPRGEKDGVSVGSMKGNCAVIGIAVDGGPVTTLDKTLPSVGVYGNRYLQNRLTGIGSDVEASSSYNVPFSQNSGILISTGDSVEGHMASRAVAAAHNVISETKAGAHVSGSAADTLLYQNDFANGNGYQLKDSGSVRTVLVEPGPWPAELYPVQEDGQAAVTVYANGFSDVSGVLVCAQYRAGTLVSCALEEARVWPFDTGTFSFVLSDADEVRFYLLDSFDTLRPLAQGVWLEG